MYTEVLDVKTMLLTANKNGSRCALLIDKVEVAWHPKSKEKFVIRMNLN